MAFNSDKFIEERFIELRDKHDVKTVFETGTNEGDTTQWLAQNFKQVVSIENNETYLKKAFRRLDKCENVILHNGDSGKDLHKLLHYADGGQCMFYLDAHWHSYWPLLDELKQIADVGIKPVIAIHDCYNPNWLEVGLTKGHYDEYKGQRLDYEYIKEAITDIYGIKFVVSYNKIAAGAKRGIIYIEPK